MIHASILDTVGRTPIVKLSKLAPPHVSLYAKVESFNPMGSVKDRLALALIEAAEDLGAGAWQTFRRVLLPLLMPSVGVSFLLCFLLSFDDFLISFFVSGVRFIGSAVRGSAFFVITTAMSWPPVRLFTLNFGS